jgi:hypothetical protein
MVADTKKLEPRCGMGARQHGSGHGHYAYCGSLFEENRKKNLHTGRLASLFRAKLIKSFCSDPGFLFHPIRKEALRSFPGRTADSTAVRRWPMITGLPDLG